MSIASTGISTWEDRAALSVRETANVLGLSEATIFRLIANGTIASVLIGGSRRIPTSAVKKVLTADPVQEVA